MSTTTPPLPDDLAKAIALFEFRFRDRLYEQANPLLKSLLDAAKRSQELESQASTMRATLGELELGKDGREALKKRIAELEQRCRELEDSLNNETQSRHHHEEVARGLTEEISKCEQQSKELQEQNEQLKKQWKDYCDSYDQMMARWKDEKRDIASRCGYPWDVNDVGLEPWIAADELRRSKEALEQQSRDQAALIEKLIGALPVGFYDDPTKHGGHVAGELSYWDVRRINEVLSSAHAQGFAKECR